MKRTPSFEVEQLKKYDPKTKRATFAISSKSVDRYREMVLPAAVIDSWEKHYKRNPVVLWAHRRDLPMFFLGRCINVWLHEDGRPTAEFEFDSDFNDMAKLVTQQIEAKTLRMASIGFLPCKWVSKYDSEEKRKTLPDFAKKALEDGDCWVVHTEIEQIETSVCGIGANPDANNENRNIEEFLCKHFGESVDMAKLREVFDNFKEVEMKAKAADDTATTEEEKTDEVAGSGEETEEQAEVSSDADDTSSDPPGELEKAFSKIESLEALVKTLTAKVDEHEEHLVELLFKSID